MPDRSIDHLLIKSQFRRLDLFRTVRSEGLKRARFHFVLGRRTSTTIPTTTMHLPWITAITSALVSSVGAETILGVTVYTRHGDRETIQ